MYLRQGTYLQGGKYQIVSVLGQGGFGITYLAEQVLVKRKVCIKEFFPKEYYKRNDDSSAATLMSDGFAESMNRFKAKFIKEAQTIAALDHPNIIHIFEIFEENDTAYYVMEYVEGESLSDKVKRSGAMDETEAIGYIHQVAEALGYIHSEQIMHLDVKPANVMVRSKDNRTILIDFGLSKHYDTTSGDATSTTPVGVSHGFAPMEQYKEGGVSTFSPETDIYSLGATLYYLVTGTTPPQASDISEDGLPTLPSHLSVGVRRAITTAMQSRRKDRPHSIAEFIELFGCITHIKDSNTTQVIPEIVEESNLYLTEKSCTTPQKEHKFGWKFKCFTTIVIICILFGLYVRNNIIWYTTTDDTIITIDDCSDTILRGDEDKNFGALFNINIFGQGIMFFWVDVESIEMDEFEGCCKLTSITIPDSVTTIGWNAFNGCKNLEKVTIGKNVTTIELSAFKGCEKLKEIVIPNSVTEIEPAAFSGCKSLKKVTFDNSNLKEISNATFEGCSNLTTINIPNSVKSIGYAAFAECSSLTFIKIPNSVGSIDNDAFKDCSNLTKVDMPYYTQFNISIFDGCNKPSYCGKYAADDGRILVYNGMLMRFAPSALDLTEYTIPNSVRGIYYHAFSDCDSLRNVTIPDSVTSIGEWAFDGCSSLTSVTIPNSVTSIGNNAFYGCSSLTSVTIPESVTTIGGGAFRNCTSLTNVTIPDSVTTIGGSAFDGCHNLTSVTIPDSVVSIGVRAFYDCSSLTSVTIPDSVVSIGDGAFYDCSSLTSVTISDSVTTIGDYAFNGCTSLTSVTIPDSVTTIGGGAFYKCTSLTSVTIPDSVTTIGYSAFCGCSGLTSITIGDSVTTIGKGTFDDCTRLTNVYCKATTPPVFKGIGWYRLSSNLSSNCKIYVPRQSVEAYKKAEGWSKYADDIVGYDF